ncbi:hypothetical protein [Serratia liquefaciens]|uniref:hypothetical protein n=1 Tax=Serratia liquefaciens TaxID=614 RepID=UPI000E039BAF|nr:hypothetical protein [Serratia liquefaciens]SUI62273.1 Uncharacterised protein [Serratia liquefaciens]
MIKKTINYIYTGPVYRFFDEEIYANSFCEGNIRISTLESCRAYENPEQGDKNEATWHHKIDSMLLNDPDEEQIRALQWAGFSVGQGSKNIYFENITTTTVLPDAYVLCMTKHLDPKAFSGSFGKYCVEISNAHYFFNLIHRKIVENHTKSRVDGLYGDINYSDRKSLNLQTPHTHIGFIKPVFPYASQREFRFLWVVEEQTCELKKLDIKCPEAAFLCKRII